MKDTLGDYMKEIEGVSKTSLTKKTPVIIRVDGKSFHTFCKGFEKPYDTFFNECLNRTVLRLCNNIQGAKYAERHSDEMSILVTDYDSEQTEAFFDYQVEKICSVVASIATGEFIKQLFIDKGLREDYLVSSPDGTCKQWPAFDCRCFNIEKEDVEKYFRWRQKDALRNSVNSIANFYFGHKKSMNKNTKELKELLFEEKGIDWNQIPKGERAGYVCVKRLTEIETPNGIVNRQKWFLEPAPQSYNELSEYLSNVNY
jgi:tRNA(His) guanylyltransferase